MTLMQALNALDPNPYSLQNKTNRSKKERAIRIVRDWLEANGEPEAAARLQNELYIGT